MSELINGTNRGMINRTPEVIAIEINSIKDQAKRILLASSIEIGRRLVEAKELVPHGEWEDWLEKSVDYSKSTARNLMRIFEEYGSEQISLFGDSKSQALGDLSYTQAVALLGIPADEREQFVKDNDIDNMSTRELHQAIKDRDLALKDKEEAEKAAEAITKTLDKISKENEKLKQETAKEKEARLKAEREASELGKKIKNYENQRKDYLQQIEDFKVKAKEASSQGDIEEVEKLSSTITGLQDQMDMIRIEKEKLEKQLKEMPIETTEVIVEKVPDEIVQELQELRAKVNKSTSGNDKEVIKFSVQFDGLVKGFKELLGTLDEIQDMDTTDKYKAAVKGLIGKMMERL